MSVPPTGAIIAGKINRIIECFNQAGAFTERTARNTEELGIRKSLIFNRLVNQGVLVEVSQQRYFLHRENLAVYQVNRRKRVIIAMLFIFIIIVITSLLSR
ncbi:MAG: hypothetical protein IPH20_27210 [Bacteroidales bacterium]|nr:hypothetical protein [Bacteroidales bacterium]